MKKTKAPATENSAVMKNVPHDNECFLPQNLLSEVIGMLSKL